MFDPYFDGWRPDMAVQHNRYETLDGAELNRKIDDFLGQHLSTDQTMAASRAALEYRQHPDVFSAQGITEAEYVRSRLVDEGLANLQLYDGAPDPAGKSNQQPANPLMAMNPTGNQCGSLDDVTIN